LSGFLVVNFVIFTVLTGFTGAGAAKVLTGLISAITEIVMTDKVESLILIINTS